MNRGRLWLWPTIFKETAGGSVIEHLCVSCGALCLATPAESEPMCGECLRRRAGAPATVQKQWRNTLRDGPGTAGDVDREYRRQRDEAKPSVAEPWPWPEVLQLYVAIDDPRVPNAAAQMTRLAGANGWQVRITYARGTLALTTLEPTGEISEKTGKPVQTQTGPPKIVDSIAVKMTRGSVVAVGIWHDGKYFGGWSTETGPFQRLGANELKGQIRA